MHLSATRVRTPLDDLGRWTLLAALAICVLVGVPLSVRRFVHANVRPLDPVAMLMLVAVCVSLTVVVRTWWLHPWVANAPRIERRAILLLPTVSLFLLGLATATFDIPALAAGLAWLAIVGEEGLMLWRGSKWYSRADVQQALAPQLHPPVTGELPEDATQSMVRSITVDGIETVCGTLRAKFQPGQRTLYVHVGFCPPLPISPTIEFEQTDGPEAEIKLSQSLPHGARFDVRLKDSSGEAANVKLAFHATASAT